jgi:hypothetical protein
MGKGNWKRKLICPSVGGHHSIKGVRAMCSSSAYARWNQSECPKSRAMLSQVRFKRPVCITGIKVGAPPGGAKVAAGQAHPYVRIFGHDLLCLTNGRFVCLFEQANLPATGTQNFRFPVRALLAFSIVKYAGPLLLPVGAALGTAEGQAP